MSTLGVPPTIIAPLWSPLHSLLLSIFQIFSIPRWLHCSSQSSHSCSSDPQSPSILGTLQQGMSTLWVPLSSKDTWVLQQGMSTLWVPLSCRETLEYSNKAMSTLEYSNKVWRLSSTPYLLNPTLSSLLLSIFPLLIFLTSISLLLLPCQYCLTCLS